MHILTDIFTYAFRGGGKSILMIGAVLSIASGVASIAPLIGLVTFMLITGYFCALYYLMIETSATGAFEAPEFPNISNIIEDIFLPMVQIFAVMLISLIPFFIGLFCVGDYDHPVQLVLLFLGVAYFPMGMLAVIVLGYVGAAKPTIVIPAIYRAGWFYWLGVFLLCLLYVVEVVLAFYLEDLWVIGSIVMSVVGVYVLMTNARVLGVVFRERKDELCWL